MLLTKDGGVQNYKIRTLEFSNTKVIAFSRGMKRDENLKNTVNEKTKANLLLHKLRQINEHGAIYVFAFDTNRSIN